MVRIARFVSLADAALSLAACSSARIVHDTRTGGTVALRGPDGGAHEKAAALMSRKCPSGYSVVEQGEVPYGETTWASTSYQQGRRGSGQAFTQSNTTQQTEWQIVFQCNGTQAGVAPYVVRF